MSEHLKAFLADWIKWIDSGAAQELPFDRSRGLCTSFEMWLESGDAEASEIDDELYNLGELFESEGLRRAFPFSTFDSFCQEFKDSEMHLNAARLAWVRSKVAQFAEA